MRGFDYAGGELFAEAVSLADIEKKFGTPTYVYSRSIIESRWQSYDRTFGDRPHLVCYAVKANGNLAILNLLARLGSGFDIVSIGELQKVIRAGGEPAKVIFSGVGKRDDEIKAALETGIKCLNIESRSELHRIDLVAGTVGKKAPVSIRINPDVNPKTHPYISTGLKENKFGVAFEEAESVYKEAAGLANIEIVGVDCHIGSQITEFGPYHEAIDRIVDLVKRLAAGGIRIRHIDIGGGLGITYRSEEPPTPSELVQSICKIVRDESVEILVEPGRSIVGNAGILLTKVLYLKNNNGKHFAIVDAAMNDMIRPVLYDAWHDIQPVRQAASGAPVENYNVVGPVCESGDFLGLDRPLSVAEGDLLAVRDTGAYCFSSSSNYNARPRAAEVMVDDGKIYEIRRREMIEDLYRGEFLLP
jgi:diaminopimelate decarboxylase